MTRNYRRGLNRIYLVLTVGWAFYCLGWLPFSTQMGIRKFGMEVPR